MIYAILSGLTLLDVILFVVAMPHIRIERSLPLERFTLPDNATTIRENIDTTFTCDTRNYGYYADPENDCQIFHVCLPIVFGGQRSETFMWSFICPQETIFNQERFTCTRLEDSIPCQESAMFYSLNDKFGQAETEEEQPTVVESPMETSQEDNSLEPATRPY
ncbi:Cuticular protein [Nesidiocoris tenuis]|uniref:Cuticular protein n=1 Tax=Nesidiocoris tenuis TaxID=355587 RepID=A0ABN7AZK5_9HEMI|nr:Cuticular protein [Nesidiocoris tenuis]